MKKNPTLDTKLPRPRTSVADPELVRPDWTVDSRRDPALLWLDKNENTDPEILELTARVAASIDSRTYYAYPEPFPLYEKLSRYLGIRMHRLILAPGSDGVIRAVFEAFVEPGDSVLYPSPTFAMYEVYSRMHGVRSTCVPYEASKEGPFLEPDRVIAAIRSSVPKVVFLANPDSPTGSVMQAADLRRVIEAAGDAGALMFIDEAYHPFYDQTVLPWLDTYPHLVIARTCAKAWGLAGLRIGYGMAHERTIALLHKVRSNYEVNMFAVAMMEKMIDYADTVEAAVGRLNAGRDYFLQSMRELGFRTLPAHANFLHVAFGASAERIHAALADLVLYRRDFSHPALRGFSRFSATTTPRFRPVIERIREVAAGRQS